MLRRALLLATVAVLAVVTLGEHLAEADIYRYVGKDGVVHYTNIKPRSRKGRRWKRVMRTSPPKRAKAAARRGSCARCDVVPARDRSRDRYSRFDGFIYEASDLYKIPVPLIRAVIKIESDYDPHVVSAMGARGLMQLMPEVIKDMGVRNVHDPRENILGGTRLLRVLANHYNGDVVKTVAAYHAGMGSLAKYNNNVPPYPYTRQYVRLVLKQYYRFKAREQTAAAR